MPIYIPLTLDDLGEIDWDGKEFTILCRDGFAGEINVGNMQVDQDSGAGQVINDAVYERNLLFYKEKTRICRGVRHILVMVSQLQTESNLLNYSLTSAAYFVQVQFASNGIKEWLRNNARIHIVDYLVAVVVNPGILLFFQNAVYRIPSKGLSLA